MKSFTLATSLAMSLGLAQAQVRHCDSNRRPNWEDCRALVEDFGMQGSSEIAHINGELDPAPSCMSWWWNGGNCLLTHCFVEEPNDGEGDPRSLTLGQVYDLYDPIRSRCQNLRGGGEFTGNFEFVNVFNDPDRAEGAEAAEKLRRRVFNAESAGNGVMKGHLSLEEYNEWRNDTAPTEKRMAKDVLETRDFDPSELAKREDEYIVLNFEALGIRKPGEFTRGPRLPKDVDYKWEVSESQTYSVTTSVSMGASWDIFTASMGIDVSESETFTVTESLTYDVTCPKQGQVTFYPLYDYYDITVMPDWKYVEVWVPVTSDNKVNGEIGLECLG